MHFVKNSQLFFPCAAMKTFFALICKPIVTGDEDESLTNWKHFSFHCFPEVCYRVDFLECSQVLPARPSDKIALRKACILRQLHKISVPTFRKDKRYASVRKTTPSTSDSCAGKSPLFVVRMRPNTKIPCVGRMQGSSVWWQQCL